MINTTIKTYLERGLGQEATSVYEQFCGEYKRLEDVSPLEGIKKRRLRMYAVEQSTDVDDFSDILAKISQCYPAFKKICLRPKSHLKSINEVRPIDTIKRVGYESIPYLASHSEDWLARTATGLKPARLFSRVEEIDFHIYENRVVKTLIDRILKFLNRKISDLENKHSQITSIMNSNMQTYGFGFDKGFQIAVNTLMPENFLGNEDEIGKKGELAENLLKKCRGIRREYHNLKQSFLYKTLQGAKMVLNPLGETNVLLFDRNYNQVFYLWKEMQRIDAVKTSEETHSEKLDDIEDSYFSFCDALIRFTLDSLNLTAVGEDRFERKNDFCVIISEEDFAIKLQIKDTTRRSCTIPDGQSIPSLYRKFSYSENTLYWENDITDQEIREFCKTLITSTNGKEKNKQQHRSEELNKLISVENRKAGKVKEKSIFIYPFYCELEQDEELKFKKCVQIDLELKKEHSQGFNINSLPLVKQTEQKLTDYAINSNENTAILPLSLFDINSYRRIQKILLSFLIDFNVDKCPYCGQKLWNTSNGLKCNDCGLIVTTTVCPNKDCRYEYKYLWYSTKEEKMREMRDIQKDDFISNDSLYQYKDIVDIEIKNDRFFPICPKCKQSQ